MTASEFRVAIAALGLSQVGTGRFLGDKRGRKGQRYAAAETPVPKPVAMLLRLMIEHGVKPEDFTNDGSLRRS